MKDNGFVQSLESGGKRFGLLAGSNRRNLVFRERASLVLKVQSNRAFIGPFVGVAEEICLARLLLFEGWASRSARMRDVSAVKAELAERQKS